MIFVVENNCEYYIIYGGSIQLAADLRNNIAMSIMADLRSYIEAVSNENVTSCRLRKKKHLHAPTVIDVKSHPFKLLENNTLSFRGARRDVSLGASEEKKVGIASNVVSQYRGDGSTCQQ